MTVMNRACGGLLSVLVLALTGGCAASHSSQLGEIRLANLSGERPVGFARLQRQFEADNPGVRMNWLPGVHSVAASDRDRVLFVHGADTQGRPLSRMVQPVVSDLTVGDIVLLLAGVIVR